MFDQEFIDRFEAKIAKGDGCWEWTASLAGKGYGQMKLPKQRKQEYSHRLAYMIYKGPILDGMYICSIHNRFIVGAGHTDIKGGNNRIFACFVFSGNIYARFKE